ncbi:MAG TPA: dihydrofolate reductase family protein [Candidatus Limnocylindria bacterium]|nr:dihydrofolate reductase family protein [Candidatus Limnocylindria bacterium]
MAGPHVEHRVDRLWPHPAAGLDLDAAFADLQLPDAPADRPLVGVNMVTSVDGRAQLAGTAEGLGSRADRRLMQLYRARYDAVASGAGTLRADDFYASLPADLAAARSAAGRPAHPLALLIAGEGPVPVERRFFAGSAQPRAVAVGSGSPHASGEPLPNVETWVAPTREPEPAWLLGRLAERAVRSLLIEGGPTVNAAFLEAGALDELYWTVGPRLVAADALPMIASLRSDHEPIGLRLVSVHRNGDELFLRYRRGGIGA